MEAASVGARASRTTVNVRAIVAALSFGAAAIHLSTSSEHGWWLFAAGFLAMGAFQIVWGIAALMRPHPLVLWAGVCGNAGIVAIWAIAHGVGLPFGPGAGEAEPSGIKDITATSFEVLLIVGTLTLVRPGIAPILRNLRVPTAAAAGLVAAGAIAAGLAIATPHGHGPHTADDEHGHGAIAAAGSQDSLDHGHQGSGVLDWLVGLIPGVGPVHGDHGAHRGGGTHTAQHGGDPNAAGGHSHSMFSASLGLGAAGHHGSTASFAVTDHSVGHAGSGHGSTAQHGGSGHGSGSGGVGAHDHQDDRAGDRRGGGHHNHGKKNGGRHGDDHGGGGNRDDHQSPGGEPEGTRLGSYTASWHPREPAADGEPAKGSALVFHGPDSSGGTGGHHDDAPCNPTRAQEEAAQRLYLETAEAIEKYDNHPERAVRDGFVTAPIFADRIIHMGNPRRIDDPTVVDPDEIEALVYAVTDRGLSLVAGLYLMPKPGMDGPQVGGCITQWHNHDGAVALLASAGTRRELPQMMHVWTYPGLDPYGHYNGRTISQLWSPGKWLPSVCRESSDPNSGCLP